MKNIILMLSMLVITSAQASTTQILDILKGTNTFFTSENVQGLNWKVGDELNFKLKMSFISGKMKMSVAEVTESTITLKQDINLSGQAQSCVTKLNPNNGETQSITCNGQNQNIPNKDDLEIIEMTNEKITVPAGTFDSIHVKIKQKSDNKIIEQWVNMQELPITGMLKAISPSQFGNVVVELESFKKN